MNEDNDQREGPRRKFLDKAVVAGVVMTVGVMIGVGVPSFIRARNTSQQNACVGNLRFIDAGKEQAAMKYKLVDGDTISSVQVNEFVVAKTTPICPGGGVYTYNNVGQQPTCSVKAPTPHQLP